MDEEGDEESADEEKEKLIDELEKDINIGEELANEIIPRAIYYYMDLIESDDDDMPEGSDEDEEEVSDDEDKGSHAKAAKKKKDKKESGEGAEVGAGQGQNEGGNKPADKKECKNQ